MKNTALQELDLFTTPRLHVERIKPSHMHNEAFIQLIPKNMSQNM